jgi:hypothetical protein
MLRVLRHVNLKLFFYLNPVNRKKLSATVTGGRFLEGNQLSSD